MKLTSISSKINNLDIVLSVLEAKLNSVPGLDSGEVPKASVPTPSTSTASSTTSAPQSTVETNSEPQGGGGSGMVKASEHPDYAPFFKLQRLGVPMPVVSAKTSAAGLDPAVLDNPDALIPLSGGGGGGGGGATPSAPPSKPATEQSSAAGGGMVKASDHPDYAPFFKLQRLGVPMAVVSAKTSAAGLDPGVLGNPDAMIPLKGGAPGNQPLSRRIFDKFDPGNSGHISTGQFQAMALEFGVFLTGNALSVAVKMIDHDGSGTIEYGEFLNWYKQSSFSKLALDDATLQRRTAASKAFSKYDADKSGFLDVEEFRGLHKELKAANLTSHSCEKALEDIDTDGDGKIQFNEFVEWLDRH